MSDKFKDKACKWLTKKKVGIGSVIIAGVYVLLFSALLIGTTTAKYAESRDLFTDYSLARFNAVILGNLGENYEQAMENLENSEIKVFGQDFDGFDLKPGLENKKELEFTISNGLNIPDNIANTDIQYTVKLRTTANIPLEFSLKYYDNSTVENGTVIVKPITIPGVKTATIDVTDREGDAKWDEYTFFEQIVNEREIDKLDEFENPILDDESNPIKETIVYKTQGGEKTFDLPLNNSESGLNLNRHSLVISWPTAGTSRQGKTRNDTAYMKEVEMLEVYVSVTNKNSEKVTEIDSDDPRGGKITKTRMPGLIRLVDGANYGEDVITPDNYSLTFSAFHDDPATFELCIDDGIMTNFEPDDAALSSIPIKTTYSMKIRMPVTELVLQEAVPAEGDHPAVSEEKFNSSGFECEVRFYDNKTEPITLQKADGLRKYYLVDLTGEDAEELILAYDDRSALNVWDNLSDKIKCKKVVYREDTMSINNVDQYERVLNNRNTIDGKEVIIGNLDKAYIVLKKDNTYTANVVPGLFAAKYPIYIEVTAKYTDGFNG